MVLVPEPGTLDDGFDGVEPRLPTEELPDLCGIADQLRRITWSPRAFDDWDWVAGNLTSGLNDLANRIAIATAEIKDIALFHVEGEPVGVGEIGDVDVVADTGTIRRRVIGAENLHLRLLAEWHLEDVGDDVGFLPVMFAEFLRAASGIKIAEANIGEAVLAVLPV